MAVVSSVTWQFFTAMRHVKTLYREKQQKTLELLIYLTERFKIFPKCVCVCAYFLVTLL